MRVRETFLVPSRSRDNSRWRRVQTASPRSDSTSRIRVRPFFTAWDCRCSRWRAIAFRQDPLRVTPALAVRLAAQAAAPTGVIYAAPAAPPPTLSGGACLRLRHGN